MAAAGLDLMANYLITGGCGFIGSHLADWLVAQGHEVRILDNLTTGRRENAPAAADLVVGDVTDAGLVRQATQDVDGVFHLAAVASVELSAIDWIATHTVNLTGAVTVFDAVRRAARGTPVPVVYASSAAVYGNPASLPLGEDAPVQPLTAYGADKVGCELHARVATAIHGVPTLGLRFFNVYGPRQDPRSPYSGVISIFCDLLSAGAPLTIYGDGEQVRDFVHVADVVRFLVCGMEAPGVAASVFNVCTGTGTSLLTLAQEIADVTGTRSELRFRPARAGDIRASVGDPSRARQRFGLSAEVALRDGLKDTLAALPPQPAKRPRYA
jgi:UDP-glucose 4-epimerase